MAEEPDADLAEIRARLDQVDRALTELLAQRLDLAGRVATIKARSRDKLFHRDREELIVARRREAATARGLDPELVEDVFRRIILQSHRAQSEIIRRSRPIDSKTIAIIGGRGAMGGFFARFFAQQGHTVLVADLETNLSPTEAASQADITLVSVPIAVTLDVIRAVGPHVRPEGLLMDATSLKSAPVRAMLDATGAAVVGAHPMFSPAVGSIHRQVVALCPARGERWASWLRDTLLSQGAEIVECAPDKHDRVMAVIQSLRHAATMAFGRALRDLNVDIAESLRFSSPIYRLELIMVGRLFGQSPELYADLGLGNEFRGPAIDALENAVRAVARVVRDGDREAFLTEFRRIAEYFDDFSGQAMAESSSLIAAMVERM